MNGGYVMVDCHGLDLTKGSTEQTIDGLYTRVQKAMKLNKPIVGHNCKWGNIPVTPIHTFALQYTENMIICTASTLQIRITNADVVTIENMGA